MFWGQRSNFSELSSQYEICGENGISHALTALLAGLESEHRTDDRASTSRKVQKTGIPSQLVIERRLAILEQRIESTEEKLLREARSIRTEVHDLDQTNPSTEQAKSTQSSPASATSDLHQEVLALPQASHNRTC